MSDLDVLIVTAVKDEWEAVLEVDKGPAPGNAWETHRTSMGLDMAVRDFGAVGGTLRIAVTQALGMGGASAVIAAAQLLPEYHVRCLAMCGVCAGRRGDVELGDVIIADTVWQRALKRLCGEASCGSRSTTHQLSREALGVVAPIVERAGVHPGAVARGTRPSWVRRLVGARVGA